MIHNPILPGMNPDPSLLRVGEDYYIAVSTFEWRPGIRIFHSRDLAHWTYLTALLPDSIDLRGNGTNCSIWAPQISYDGQTYYCLFTNVRSTKRPFKDCRNYVMTAPSIEGPWSQPHYLLGSGFDPSLFHDEDGRSWLLHAHWDFRIETPNKSAGIVMQEFHRQSLQAIGQRKLIFPGTDLRKTEAPHLYRIGNYYYLFTAEGGTGRDHSVTIARSQELWGPYEVSPYGSLLTARDHPEGAFQCTGHASLVQTQTDQWYMAFLLTRPQGDFTPLGRETGLEQVVWDAEGWPHLSLGGHHAHPSVPGIGLDPSHIQKERTSQTGLLNPLHWGRDWHWLRSGAKPEWVHPGPHGQDRLIILSGESTQSLFDQHMLAFRQQDHHFRVEVDLVAHPTHSNQMAGLVYYLSTEKHLYCYVTWDEVLGKVLAAYNMNEDHHLLDWRIPLQEEVTSLAMDLEEGRATLWLKEGGEWRRLDCLDVRDFTGGFTGNYIGLAVQDLDDYQGFRAEFSNFVYTSKE